MTMYEQAFKDAKQSFEEKEKEQVKKWVTELLTKREELSKEKEKIEEKIRIIGKELEDLKEGKLDRIKERHEKSNVAGQLSSIRIIQGDWTHISTYFPGTYNITCLNGNETFNKTFYL